MAAEKKEVEAQPQAAEGSAEEKKKEEEEEVQYEVNDVSKSAICNAYLYGKFGIDQCAMVAVFGIFFDKHK